MPVAVSGPGRGMGASSAARPPRVASAAVPSDNPADAKKCRRVTASTYCWNGVISSSGGVVVRCRRNPMRRFGATSGGGAIIPLQDVDDGLDLSVVS